MSTTVPDGAASMDQSKHSAYQLTKRVGNYLVGRVLGEGGYAKVRYGISEVTGEPVAIKVIEKEHIARNDMTEQVKTEINILRHISHPHIVELKEVMSSKDKIFMVMELVTGGELFHKIATDGPMNESQARILFTQLLNALGFCHSQGVYHRDLKLENVLLTPNMEVKLSDFGLGVIREAGAPTSELLTTTCGSPNYVAPEVLANRNTKAGYDGAKADIWSLGVILYTMLAGCLPFDEETVPALFEAISRGHYEDPPWLSQDAEDIVRAMLQPDPSKRASIQELWAMPWLLSHNQHQTTTIKTRNNDDDVLKQQPQQQQHNPGKALRSYPLLIDGDRGLILDSSSSHSSMSSFDDCPSGGSLMNESIRPI